jgi:carbamoyl-phosphate synthase large subunit
MGFELLATTGTARHLAAAGITVEHIKKVYQGRPNIVDAMISGTVDLVFNTTEGTKAIADSFSLRRTALIHQIPYYTTLSGATAAVQAISALRSGQLEVAPLQSYFRGSF